MGAPDFHLAFDFGIDDGELDGCSDAMIFALGFEVGRIHSILAGDVTMLPFEMKIHAVNLERAQRLVREHGFEMRYRLVHDDWLHIVIGIPRDEDGEEE